MGHKTQKNQLTTDGDVNICIGKVEIWSLWWHETGILLSSSHLCRIVWLHHLDSNEMPGEKAAKEW